MNLKLILQISNECKKPKEILKIIGQEVKERIVIVSLPGPEGYKYKKAFNMNNERISGSREVIDVCYYRTANDSKPW